MKKALRMGSRGSRLAMIQSRHVAALLEEAIPGMSVEIEVFTTRGDRVQDVPLAQIGGKGLFTEELEAALGDGGIDIAVHSLKDLPTEMPDGLCIGAVPPRATPNDALVCTRWPALDDVPDGARVGTSSLRRKAQLLAFKPALEVVDLRGNVDTRIKRVAEGTVDAAILACAGLERIGRHDAIAEVISAERMLPAAGQGALAVESRDGDDDVLEALARITDAKTRIETAAERALLSELGGGCQVPIGALARLAGEALTLRARVCSLDGTRIITKEISGIRSQADALGRNLAESLLLAGADELISEVEASG